MFPSCLRFNTRDRRGKCFTQKHFQSFLDELEGPFYLYGQPTLIIVVIALFSLFIKSSFPVLYVSISTMHYFMKSPPTVLV